ncbi:MAG: nitrous oxide reductase family maturation protein NosD [Bryobacterales bacterium]|nr:nitrous oxide reductase family maturation protein NosD [Bryobacterales bacterium]
MRRCAAGVAALICALAEAGAAELRVGPGARFARITDAVRSAQPHDVIRVSGGTYPGDLVLDTPVRLIGEGRPVIRGTGSGSIITVRAPGCVIRGFRVEHSGNSLMDEHSGILLHSSGNQITGNELSDILFGIYFYGSNDNIVRRNTIRGRLQIEQGERGAGLHFWNCLRNRIEENVISGTRDGMYLQNASESIIRRNQVTQARYGLHYMYSNGNVFEDNTFAGNVAGAAIMYSSRIQLRRNRFLHNRGFSSFGILFQDSTEITAEQNIISDNATGIFAESLRSSTFRRNLVSGNDTALEMFASVSENVFTENNFVANLTPIRVIGRTTTTRWSKGGRGNYWNEYDGYDLDGDGVGDVPFQLRNLYEKMEDSHPRLRIYFQSPAARALAAAERAFPIMRGATEADPKPLMRPVDLGIAMNGGKRRNAAYMLAAASLVGAGLLAGALLIKHNG